MSFPKYEAYKDSGVEWLGKVPEHWDSRRLKFLFSLVKRDVRSADRIVTCFRDGVVTLRENRRTEGFTNALKEIGYQGIRVGDLIIHAMDAFAGAIGVSDSDGKSSPVYSVCVPVSKSVSADYYARLLRYMALSGFVTSLAKGIRERSTDFRWSDAGEISLPVPSSEEQAQIARFLDHKTARIDASIAEQERLIELLKEKRQAVISHAVTKGLDRTAPMKDSGVEWLGEVPEHWKVTRLKFITERIVDCPHETPVYNPEGDYLVIRTADIDQGVLMPDQMYRLDEDEYLNRIRREPLLQNDIVYGREGERWGHAALVPTSNLFALGQRMMQFRAANDICPIFLMFQLNAVSTYRQGDVDTVGATSPHVNISTIKNYQLMMPPFEEQKIISKHLQEMSETLDSLIEEAMSMAEILQERRSALISAAVTGKIDVRGWKAPESDTPTATLEAAYG